MSIGAKSSVPLSRRVTVRGLVEPSVLSVGLRVVAGASGLDRVIAHPRIQKSGLGLVGYFYGISSDRVQVLGQTEVSFAQAMAPQDAERAFEAFLGRDLCCVVVTVPPPAALLRAGDATGCPVIASGSKS